MRISDWSSDVCSSDLRAILTPDVYSQRRKELQDSAASLQQRARSMRQGIDRGFSETMQKIQLVLFEEVGKLAQDRGVNLVLPRSQIVVAIDSYDITEQDRKSTRLNSSH